MPGPPRRRSGAPPAALRATGEASGIAESGAPGHVLPERDERLLWRDAGRVASRRNRLTHKRSTKPSSKSMRRCGFLALVVLVVASCSSSSPPLNGTWFDKAGRPLPRTVFSVLRGSPHCGDQNDYWIMMGWPIGNTGDPRNPATIRSYDRGFPPRKVTRPTGVADTGYHNGDNSLWVLPAGGDQAIFVRNGGRTEEWSRVPTVPFCN